MKAVLCYLLLNKRIWTCACRHMWLDNTYLDDTFLALLKKKSNVFNNIKYETQDILLVCNFTVWLLKQIENFLSFRVTIILPYLRTSTPRSVWTSDPNFDFRQKMLNSRRCRNALRRWPWSRPWQTWSSSRRARASWVSINTLWNSERSLRYRLLH